jgi:hypothetical protein
MASAGGAGGAGAVGPLPFALEVRYCDPAHPWFVGQMTFGEHGSAGALGVGGNGGDSGAGGIFPPHNAKHCGGGGGGYYGGGGGDGACDQSINAGSGGGGSSYAAAGTNSNVTYAAGVRSGHGLVTIGWADPVGPFLGGSGGVRGARRCRVRRGGGGGRAGVVRSP